MGKKSKRRTRGSSVAPRDFVDNLSGNGRWKWRKKQYPRRVGGGELLLTSVEPLSFLSLTHSLSRSFSFPPPRISPLFFLTIAANRCCVFFFFFDKIKSILCQPYMVHFTYSHVNRILHRYV